MTDLAPIPLYRSPAELREKLIALRDDILDRMRRRGAVEPGHLPLIAGIAAALETLSHTGEAEAAARAAVDDSGERIRLMLSRDGAVVAATVLAPTAALALAGQLLSAAGVRLADDLAVLRGKRCSKRYSAEPKLALKAESIQ